MTSQVLSIECMLTLKDLGIDTSNASMYWDMPHSPNFQHKLNIVGVNGNLKAAEQRKYTIGAFTLQDIMELLPSSIYARLSLFTLKVDGFHSAVLYSAGNDIDNTLCYFGNNNHTNDYSTLLQAAYEMLVWCANNGHIKTTK